jgi:tripartite ATP-independent transporter DctP family solute receptor
MKKFKLFGLVMISLLLILSACGSSPGGGTSGSETESQNLRLGHIFPVDSVKDQAAKRFADRIEEETNGEITIKVFPASQLGGDEVLAQDISRGTLDMSFLSQGSLSGLDPLLDFHYLPYVVTNYEEADAIYYGDGIIPTTMKETLLKHKMVSLGIWENEFRGVSNSQKAVKSVEDLKGLKLRVPGSQAIKGFFDEAGVQTVVMPFNELYLGLQQGTVDGQDNGLLLTYDSKFHEVNSHYTALNHVYATGSIVINEAKLKGMTEEQQEIFKTVGKEIEQWQVEKNREETKKYIDLMKKEGVEFVELTPEQIKEFQDFGLAQWDNHADIYGQERIDKLKEEVEQIKQ